MIGDSCFPSARLYNSTPLFKGKPAARRGRKASGLRVEDLQIAGLPAGIHRGAVVSLCASAVHSTALTLAMQSGKGERKWQGQPD